MRFVRASVTTWPVAHCSAGKGAAAIVSSMYKRSASRCGPSTARAASTWVRVRVRVRVGVRVRVRVRFRLNPTLTRSEGRPSSSS